MEKTQEYYEFHLRVERMLSNFASNFVNIKIGEYDSVIMKTLKEIEDIVDGDRVYIFEIDHKNQVMNNTYEWCKNGIKAEIDNLQKLPLGTFKWWMEKISNNESIYIENVEKMPKEAEAEKKILQAQNIESLVVVPIYDVNKALGFLGVDNIIKSELWSDNNKSILKIISKLLSDLFLQRDYKKEMFLKNRELYESIKKQEKLQSEIIQKEKMISVAQLSAGLAHEFNNSLGVMKSNIELLDDYYNIVIEDYNKKCLEKIKNSDIQFIMSETESIFTDIHESFKKIEGIISSIRQLTIANENEKVYKSINDMVKETLWIYKSKTYNNLEIELNLNEVKSILCYPNDIEDSINNILKNSIENFNNKNIENPKITINTCEENEYVEIEIIDNGGGIEKENQNRVFEPFYTTKDVGEGYGIGLSMTYDTIVNKHKGKIDVESKLGEFTKFKIKLPKL